MLYLEIIRIPMESLPEYSQLRHFQYNPFDHHVSDAQLMMKAEDEALCSTYDSIKTSTSVVIVLEQDGEEVFLVNQELKQILKITNPHKVIEVTEEELVPKSSIVFSGSLDALSLQSGEYSLSSLPMGSQEEVEKAIIQLNQTKQYRRICYKLFQELADKQGYIDSNTTLHTTIPYLVNSPLFPTVDTFSASLFNYDSSASFFSSFENLTNPLLHGNTIRHIGRPIDRHLSCSIDTSMWRDNSFYRQKMENSTMVDGVLLKDREEVEEEGTVYRVNQEGIKHLRYMIEKRDEIAPVDIELIIPSQFILSELEKQCTLSTEAPFIELSNEYIQDHIHTLVRLTTAFHN